ncbi:MAG TPA: hypothetical protein VGQ99_20280 [Tepidisphaeraceae bacterium]|jgi:hypothetical protein|nr:hypothetical protein [Tepidisphaeraceae bacterium]
MEDQTLKNWKGIPEESNDLLVWAVTQSGELRNKHCDGKVYAKLKNFSKDQTVAIANTLIDRKLLRPFYSHVYTHSHTYWELDDKGHYHELALIPTQAGFDEADRVVAERKRKASIGRRLLTVINHNWIVTVIGGLIVLFVGAWSVWKLGWNH